MYVGGMSGYSERSDSRAELVSVVVDERFEAIRLDRKRASFLCFCELGGGFVSFTILVEIRKKIAGFLTHHRRVGGI